METTYPLHRLAPYGGDAMNRILPDTLAYVSSWVPRSDLLALRVAFATGRDAVRRAVTIRPDCHSFSNFDGLVSREQYYYGPPISGQRVSTRAIEAIGRVFGPGCRSLYFNATGSWEAGFRADLAALKSFVKSTDGGLEELNLRSTDLSLAELLELCRLCPRLTSLLIDCICTAPLQKTGGLAIATPVTQICPMLSCVKLPSNFQHCIQYKDKSTLPKSTPAETWEMLFPNLKKLSFDPSTFRDYRPSLFEAIDDTIEKCKLATEVDFRECVVEPSFMDRLIRSPLATRLTRMSIDKATVETILHAARGFSKLRDLTLPNYIGDNTMSWPSWCWGAFPTKSGQSRPAAVLEFIEGLHRARPELTRLSFGLGENVDDACVKRVFALFGLQCVEFKGNMLCARTIVDSLLASPCSKTLQEIQFDHVSSPEGGPTDTIFDSVSILRIIVDCPSLLKVTWKAGDILWDHEFEGCEPDTSKLGYIDAILKSRGGQLSTDVGRDFWWKSPPRIEPYPVDY